MVTTAEPTNVEVFQIRLRRAVRSWRFWAGVAVVAALVAGWGLNFYNYTRGERGSGRHASAQRIAEWLVRDSLGTAQNPPAS